MGWFKEFCEDVKKFFSSSADKRIAAIEANFAEQSKLFSQTITDLNTKWQESEEKNKNFEDRVKKLENENETLKTNLKKTQKLLSEYITHCNEVNSHYSNDKEEYTKKCNDVMIALSSIAGNLLAQKSSLESQISETRIKLKNNPKSGIKTSLEINLEKLTKDYERIANEEEKINKEIRNTKIDKDKFIKTINERIASCTKERDDIAKEMSTIFDDPELKERSVSEILAEYDRNNASLEVN